MSRFEVVHIDRDEADEFVRTWHRHHEPAVGDLFRIGLLDLEAGAICGIAQAGRPVSRMLQDGITVEVVRLATDGTEHAASALYRAIWRATLALGYKKLITYTMADEGGASLRGAGYKLIGVAGGGSWSRPSRPRIDTHPLQEKLRWEMTSEVEACSS